jgi:threonine/homoserine/homoserine lactone efflux protein
MINETLLSVLSITGAITLGAMSPGQSFILVARTAVASSRRDGMAVALGMGIGCFIFALIALLGLQSLLLALPWLYTTLKMLGGAYLIYLAFKMLRGAHQPLMIEAVGGQQLGFRRAFTTGLLKPSWATRTPLSYSAACLRRCLAIRSPWCCISCCR